MLRIGAASLIGLSVLGWIVLGPGFAFNSGTPPTIQAEPGPVKQRPVGYIAGVERAHATPISAPQPARHTPALDINLRLAH